MLILSLAGSAMAQNAILLDENGNPSDNPLELLPESTTDFGIFIYNLDSTEFHTYPYVVSVTTFNSSSNLYDIPADSNEITAVLLKTSVDIASLVNDNNEVTDLNVVRVHLTGNAPVGDNYKVTVIVGPSSISQIVSASSVIASVPEFPTVALPVAAILGLVFIFGRKKERL